MAIQFVVPIIIFLTFGGAAGVLLTFASRVFYVEIDETVDRILEHLPGINCGACGFSSCEAYAEGIKKDNIAPNLCKPGGQNTATGIGGILGVDVELQERETAYVHCAGVTTEDKFVYNATLTCAAAGRYYRGRINCENGCLGYGDCADVCVYNAVSIVNGVAVIDPKKCFACGMCLTACPHKLISLRKHSERIKVRCSSNAPTLATKAVCKNGCLACKLCEKKCMRDAIQVVDNCAVIDYDKCLYCDVCAMVCPAKCIVADDRWGNKN